ncbi:VOC family protein [Thermonema rossianum]|jgi:catechol 2,3-dioxygenase-like lactoylglutathione lyase family enzyme|uniref:VOC family protein n=1 Tax=Thermonema rossianum TaxID=55505 RepID=UPI00056E175C|nr:VOC family protein [Thermonema rossianum]
MRYVHTNLIAKDWRRLADFYINVFGCVPVPPERHYEGEDLERATGIEGAILEGVHLRLPGWGEEGPTLEIFSYNNLQESLPAAVNRPGYTHIAFEVEDVAAIRRKVIAHGGSAVGDIVTLTARNGAKVTWCYMRDPEGNMIELQRWSKP